MRKEFLKTAKVLNKAEQKKIFGGYNEFDTPPMGICIVNGHEVTISCDRTCPNGSVPICPVF